MNFFHKTSKRLLYQRMNDLLSSGIPKDRILHVNFEDDRLMGITAEDLRYVPEVLYCTPLRDVLY